MGLVWKKCPVSTVPGLRWSFNLKINQQISDAENCNVTKTCDQAKELAHCSSSLYNNPHTGDEIEFQPKYNTKLDRNTVCTYITFIIYMHRYFLLGTRSSHIHKLSPIHF